MSLKLAYAGLTNFPAFEYSLSRSFLPSLFQPTSKPAPTAEAAIRANTLKLVHPLTLLDFAPPTTNFFGWNSPFRVLELFHLTPSLEVEFEFDFRIDECSRPRPGPRISNGGVRVPVAQASDVGGYFADFMHLEVIMMPVCSALPA